MTDSQLDQLAFWTSGYTLQATLQKVQRYLQLKTFDDELPAQTLGPLNLLFLGAQCLDVCDFRTPARQESSK